MVDGRVLVIGLDGATWNVLTPFMEEGDLPNLRKIAERGSFGELQSTIPPLSAPAWATFLTGKSPARHGVFHFVDWSPENATEGDTPAGLVDGRSIDSPTMWDVAAHANRKVGVINVPMSYPPRPVNGFMITGLLTPPEAAVFTYPPELSNELGDYQIDLDRFISDKPFAASEAGDAKRQVKPDLQLVEEFQHMEETRGRAARRLMAAEPWDVFTVVFTGTDRMGHYLWPYHRAVDQDGSPEAAELHQAVRRFYVMLDEMIGDLVDQAGEETTVFVISDHGMGPIYAKNTHWNNWLYKQGFLKLRSDSSRTLDGWLLRLRIPRDKLRKLASFVPGGLSNESIRKVKRAPTAQFDPGASTAYYERWFDPIGGIRVNASGQERERIITELMSQVRDLTDPDTGERIVREVFRREDRLAGPHLEQAPDIVMVMNSNYGSSDRLSNYSSIVTARPNIGDPGGHQIEGIMIAAGPELARSDGPLTGLSIEDVAPTILHAMGIAVPSDMDGHVLTQLFDPASLAERPVVIGSPAEWWPDEEIARAEGVDVDHDEEAVRDRLRALGYFE